MKKTLFTLACAALVAPALAVDVTVGDLTTYTATFANSRTETQTGARSHLLLNGGETAITLNSWMIEFDIIKGSDSGTYFATAYNSTHTGTTVEHGGLGVRTDSAEKIRFTLDGNSASRIGDPIEINVTSATSTSPITLRMAYDAVAGEAYLCYMGSDGPTCVTMTLDNKSNDFYLNSVAATDVAKGNNGDIAGKSMFWTYSGNTNYTLKGVTDLSKIAGESDLVKQYVTTKTLPVPEPATATLSLLALAGLAARRRRH